MELGSPDPGSPDQWLDAVRREERRGELIAAFDIAERGVAAHPEDRLLKHRAVLVLARSGATDEAARRFAEYGLAGVSDEDIAALGARIAKDVALSHRGAERRRLAAEAAELYGEVFSATRGYYPAVNAATLWLLAGEAARSRELAAVVVRLTSESGDDSYYAAATAAEGNLLLNRPEEARGALELAAARHGGDYAALATTRRQLRVICDAMQLDQAILSPLAGPGVVHFCGHRVGAEAGTGRFPPEAEAAAARSVADVVSRRPPGYGYGALAGGADILWAEALLAAGAELHVVLPFSVDEFIELSVAPCGAGWVERFHRCLAAATAVRYANEDARFGDDTLLRYGSDLAMGLALLRARYLDADVWQLAVWDGGPAAEAGTSGDVATWRRTGRPATIVSPSGGAPADGSEYEEARPGRGAGPVGVRGAARVAGGAAPERMVRAILFGDVKGFSKLGDEQYPVFTGRVLGVLADVIRRRQDEVCFRNTWGDALYVVLTDTAVAARCALELQEAMAAIDLGALGLPTHLALRLGGHVGPVYATYDPVRETDGFWGSHVSRTARIEPVTPPGAVYVTEAFAAALALAGQPELACDYVGHMPAAKDYGHLRMYRLRRAQVGSEPL